MESTKLDPINILENTTWKKVIASQSYEILKITQIVIFHYFLSLATIFHEMVKSTYFQNDVTFDCEKLYPSDLKHCKEKHMEFYMNKL